MTTRADRAEINRRNARKSTGPKTPEGKARSRFNAVKHGMTAKTPVLPGEDAEALQARLDAWTADLAPGNEVEQYLVGRAVRASWQLDRADRVDVARLTGIIESATDQEALRQAEEAEVLGRRLFWDRRGPIALYPHFPLRDELSPDRKPRVSFSGLDDDPDDPARLVLRLESTRAGCQWLLDRWQELRVVLQDELTWQSPDKLKAIRLMGKQPIDAADHADVAEVFLASWVLGPNMREIDAFDELWKEMLPPEANLFRQRLLGREIDDYLPEDRPAAVAALLKIVDMHVARLETLAASHRDRAAAVAAEATARLSFDPSADGERLRRYQAACGRSLDRSIATLLKVRRAEERRQDRGPDNASAPGPGDVAPPSGDETAEARGSQIEVAPVAAVAVAVAAGDGPIPTPLPGPAPTARPEPHCPAAPANQPSLNSLVSALSLLFVAFMHYLRGFHYDNILEILTTVRSRHIGFLSAVLAGGERRAPVVGLGGWGAPGPPSLVLASERFLWRAAASGPDPTGRPDPGG